MDEKTGILKYHVQFVDGSAYKCNNFTLWKDDDVITLYGAYPCDGSSLNVDVEPVTVHSVMDYTWYTVAHPSQPAYWEALEPAIKEIAGEK